MDNLLLLDSIIIMKTILTLAASATLGIVPSGQATMGAEVLLNTPTNNQVPNGQLFETGQNLVARREEETPTLEDILKQIEQSDQLLNRRTVPEARKFERPNSDKFKKGLGWISLVKVIRQPNRQRTGTGLNIKPMSRKGRH